MRILPLLAAGLATAPTTAAELRVTLEIPRLAVAEYHRPYVAIWVERADQQAAATLAVWYDMKQRNAEGEKWLKDLRQWWRRAGRQMQMPVDGVSGATRAPGRHAQAFDAAGPALAGLAPGSYALVVEAAREVGGRELLRLPFQWPPAAEATQTARGSSELGAVSLEIKP
jgi:hypothetical protein